MIASSTKVVESAVHGKGQAKISMLDPPAVPKAGARKKRWVVPIVIALGIVAVSAAGGWYWWQQHRFALPAGFAKANGRLESEQVEIATKLAGRIAVVLVNEGQMVDAGQVVARMDTDELEAEVQSAKAQVDVAEREQAMAEAIIIEEDSKRTLARQELARTKKLYQEGAYTAEQLDQATNNINVAQAAYDTAVAARKAADANNAADQAKVAQIQSQIDDSALVAPRPGRIEHKLAQPGEVLPAGGRVLTLLDLSDIYMTIFLPGPDAGRLALGGDARLVLDAIPEFVIPAKITFVATDAQFTPKTVETSAEREKLMFRVKLSIDPDLVRQHMQQAKTGLRGIGYVRTTPDAVWPDYLAVKLPAK